MLYSEAESIIKKVEDKKGSVKALYLASKYKNKRALYALVCETLKYDAVLEDIIKRSDLNKKVDLSLQKSKWLLRLLVYDFLFGKGIREASKKHRSSIEKNKTLLRSTLVRIKVEQGVVSNHQLLPDTVKSVDSIPRYARVNTLKTNVADVVAHFRMEDYTQIPVSQAAPYDRYLDLVKELKKKQFLVDLHLPELLVFAPRTDLHDHVLYERGDIILQDKASCIPAHVLDPPPLSHVIDCCAAPGNKTTHAAARLANKGRVFAFDKDARRLATMNTLTLTAGVLNVTLANQDFLMVDPTDALYKNVSHVIVDPSCSGSGIATRHDQEGSSQDRLEKLAEFQHSILLHALSFPAAMKVVYSTCSVHQIENEGVVSRTLARVKDKFRLEPVLTSLPSRGSAEFSGGDYCVRLTPEKDLCTGFFVACFVRLSQEERIRQEDSVTEPECTMLIDNGEPPLHDSDPEEDQHAAIIPDENHKHSHIVASPQSLTVDDNVVTGTCDIENIPETTPKKKRKKNKKQRKRERDTEVETVEREVADKDTCTESMPRKRIKLDQSNVCLVSQNKPKQKLKNHKKKRVCLTKLAK